MEKKLYRVMENKMLTGVCTGLAEYFDMDLNLVRVLAVIGGLVFFPVVIAYAAMSFILPEKPVTEAAEEVAE